jgi:hypothetical protein
LSRQQEGFSDAFVLAVAAATGCAVAKPSVDDDSIDWTISCKLAPRRPKLDVQLKSTAVARNNGPHIVYPLKRKNYDDLITKNVAVPRVLLLVTVPKNLDHWVDLKPTRLILRRCAYWVSLLGLPPSANTQSVTVHVPRANVFNVHSLHDLMTKINMGIAL